MPRAKDDIFSEPFAPRRQVAEILGRTSAGAEAYQLHTDLRQRHERASIGYYTEQKSTTIIALVVWTVCIGWVFFSFSDALEMEAEERRKAVNFLEHSEGIPRDFDPFNDALSAAKSMTIRSLASAAFRRMVRECFLVVLLSKWESQTFKAVSSVMDQHWSMMVLGLGSLAIAVLGFVAIVKFVIQSRQWYHDTEEVRAQGVPSKKKSE